MANATEVKEYLSYWFQLGKSVVFPKSQVIVRPDPIFSQHAFSPAFEACWQRMVLSSEDCYLEGTEQSVRDLLKPEWEMISCARCDLPIARSRNHIPTCLCPCIDLASWPNLELPQPRLPLHRGSALRNVHKRLLTRSQADSKTEACLLPQLRVTAPESAHHE